MNGLRTELNNLDEREFAYVIARSKVNSDNKAIKEIGISSSTFYGIPLGHPSVVLVIISGVLYFIQTWISTLSMSGMDLSSGDVQIFLASFCALLQAMQMAMYSNSIYAYLRTVSYRITHASSKYYHLA